MVELSVPWRAVVDVLIDAPRAWQSPPQVAEALGMGVEETTDLLCDLDVAGWVVVWDGGDAYGPLVTLTVRGAERLGLRLVESGPGETPRWAHTGDPEPPAPRSTQVFAAARAAALDFVPDPAPTPDLSAVRAEQSEAHAALLAAATKPDARPPGEPPTPSLLIGVGLTPWPGPGPAADPETVCPACGSRRLRPHMYCLYCDRWGFDELTAQTASAPTPPRPPAERNPARERLLGEYLRARRKAKRQKKHDAQTEADRLRKPAKPEGQGPTPRPHPDRPGGPKR